ncbi:MAG TPA: hypothetical protein VGP68_19090 [Gemmataceae bacterium]|nr:hypothetical protein [Gemmataceae bacterium]
MHRLILFILAIHSLSPSQVVTAQESTASSLAGSLRALLLPQIPNPLYEKRDNWNHTIEVAGHIHWEGQGLDSKPKVVKTPKNHGLWKHVTIRSPNVAQSLLVNVQNVQQLELGRSTFDVILVLPAEVEYEQQNWERGVKLYSGSVRARLRVSLTLTCELTTKIEPTSRLLPEMVLRLRVLHATTAYDQLVVEHLPGIGGQAAQILGNVIVENMKKWHPSVEYNLLERLNAAIVKAGDSKDIRVGLAGLQRAAKK